MAALDPSHQPLVSDDLAPSVSPNPVTARLMTPRGAENDINAMPQACSERWPRRTRQIIAVGLLAAGILASMIAVSLVSNGPQRAISKGSHISETVVLSSQEDDEDSEDEGEEEKCHTAKEGERCYEEVIYQQKNIKKHPEWFHDLTSKSSFVEFQMSLYKQERCPKPCGYVKRKKASVEAIGGDVDEVDDDEEKKEQPRKEKEEEKCHVAVRGEKCHSAVRWVLREGIFSQPDWYRGLTKTSRIEDVQAKLHKNDPKAQCPNPCKCHTAQEGEPCHKSVIWVMTEGAAKHPKWYKGLSITSRFEEVQARLAQDKKEKCPVPCTPLPYGSPSLFCVTVVRSSGYEPDIMRKANRKSLGIFACDEYAVYSDTTFPLGAGLYTIPFVPASVGKSKDGTAGNALLFMNVWTAVKNDFRSKNLDWTVKLDPDAVLLPDRLRQHVHKHNTESVYIKNCGAYDAPGWPKMFGALEVFSRRAMAAYFVGDGKCKSELDWYTWGEDLYMERCMDHLGVGNVADLKIASDGVCIHEPNCKDGWAATFHPFKSWDSWYSCLETTIR